MVKPRKEKPGLFDEFLTLIYVRSNVVKKTQAIGRTIRAEDTLVTEVNCQVLVIFGNKNRSVSSD